MKEFNWKLNKSFRDISLATTRLGSEGPRRRSRNTSVSVVLGQAMSVVVVVIASRVRTIAKEVRGCERVN